MDTKGIIIQKPTHCDADNHSADQAHDQTYFAKSCEVLTEQNYAQSEHKPET